MLNFIKKKFSKKTIKGLYILAFTPEEMTEESLQVVIPIADKMLKEKNATFATLLDSMRKTVKTHTLNGRCRTVRSGEKTGEGIVL